MNEALSEARRPGHAHTLAQVLQTAPFVECYTGSPDEARGDAEEATEVSNQSVLLGLGNYCSWALTDKVSRFEDQRGKAQNREIRRLVMTPPVTAVSHVVAEEEIGHNLHRSAPLQGLQTERRIGAFSAGYKAMVPWRESWAGAFIIG